MVRVYNCHKHVLIWKRIYQMMCSLVISGHEAKIPRFQELCSIYEELKRAIIRETEVYLSCVQ